MSVFKLEFYTQTSSVDNKNILGRTNGRYKYKTGTPKQDRITHVVLTRSLLHVLSV